MTQTSAPYNSSSNKEKPHYHWYAIRPFTRAKCKSIIEQLEQAGINYLRPYKLHLIKEKSGTNKRNHETEKVKEFCYDVFNIRVKSSLETALIFFFSTREVAKNLMHTLYGCGTVYAEMMNDSWEPLPIPQGELIQFQRLLMLGGHYRILDDFPDVFQKGKKVLVIDGKYKNFRGVIYRIQNHKHLIIRLQKGCAVMLGYVPKIFLKELDESETVDARSNDDVELNIDADRPEALNPSFDIKHDFVSEENENFNTIMSHLAVLVRMLPNAKTEGVTHSLLQSVLQTYEAVAGLRQSITDLDTRLGFDVTPLSPSVKELDMLIHTLQTKLAIPFTPEKTDSERETITQNLIMRIRMLCSRIN